MAEKKTQLHEVLAVEADLTNSSKAILAETLVTFTKKTDHFRGGTRKLSYYDEAKQSLNEQDGKEMVTTVADKLEYAFKHMAKLYDALAQKEEANQRARADLVVDGIEIGRNLPATFLLGMEARLKGIQEVIQNIPTLDPSIVWTKDEGAGPGVFRAAPQHSKRTEKQVNHKVLYEATKEHPAQIEKWNEDVPVADIEVVQTSGMWTPRQKSDAMERVGKLLAAVKKARQRANTVEVEKFNVGQAMLNYIAGEFD